MDLLNRRARAAMLLAGGLALGCSEPPTRTGIVQEVRAEERQVLVTQAASQPGAAPESAWLMVPGSAHPVELVPGQRIAYRLRSVSGRPEIAEVSLLGWAGEAEGWLEVPGGGRIRARRAPPLRLDDQAGRSVDLAQWRGGLALIDFIYTRCPGPCPAQTHDLVTVQRALSPAARERTRFFSVTLEPDFDDGSVLLAYATRHGVDLSNWSFLTGPPPRVEAVVRAWGIGASDEDDGTIAHTLHSFLVDHRGYVVARYSSRDRNPEAILEDIERFAQASAGASPPALQ